MSESGDYTPAPQWKGHGSFDTAYRQYDQHAGRSYDNARATGATASKLLPESIATQSTHPLVIDTDFTGSMIHWDATIVSKFPYLDHEMRTEYLGEDAEISFGAIADTGDEYTLQVRPFAKGPEMKEKMDELVHAGGGKGPGVRCEAHGVAALYRLHNTHVPRSLIKPIYIIITDEMPYHLVSKDDAMEKAKVDVEGDMKANEIYRQLMGKYSAYVILKPYFSDNLSNDVMSSDTAEVYGCWKGIVGAERIALLPDPNRVVDVIFGILAKESGMIGYFRNELEGRQLPDKNGRQKVDTVYRSLATIHALSGPRDPKDGRNGNSMTTGLGGGKPRKPLA